jgi:hypothetical protein
MVNGVKYMHSFSSYLDECVREIGSWSGGQLPSSFFSRLGSSSVSLFCLLLGNAVPTHHQL